jgi:fatty-acyl-CoA synthase
MSFPVFDILAKRADLGPQRMALEEVVNGHQVSYQELHLRAGRTAALLDSLGVSRGDRVSLLCRNRIEFFELIFACAKLGAILVPLNWRMPAKELAALLDDCGAGWLIYGAEDRQTIADLSSLQLLCLDLDDTGESGYRALRDTREPLQGREAWPADETWYLLYT